MPSRTRSTQYSYFLPVDRFPENVYLLLSTFSTLPNCDRIMRFSAARSHVNKKRREARAIESCNCLPWHLPRSTRLPMSCENAGTQFPLLVPANLACCCTSNSAIAAKPFVTSIFTYLFDSVWHSAVWKHTACYNTRLLWW